MRKCISGILAMGILLNILSPQPLLAESLIKDAVLEEAIQAELKQDAADDVILADLQTLKSLYPKNTEGAITDLQGLEFATNITSLFLPNQELTDIQQIGALTSLTFLALNGNQIHDLSPLSSLHNLQKLVIDNNRIEDLRPVSNLTKLTDLLASGNQITDLSPVAGAKLKWLLVSSNQIQDLEPLRGHPTLEQLYLDHNRIQDIAVLETIPNLKTVIVDNNPLNEQAADILDNLAKKGVVTKQIPMEQTRNQIKVMLDATPVTFEVAPFITDEGTLLVPFRPIFERLGLNINWNEASRTITGEKAGTKIILHIDNNIAEVNGKFVEMSVAPSIVSGNTFVPLRFVAESLESIVQWDASRNMAVIRSKQDMFSLDGNMKVTVYGKWVPLKSPSPSVKLAIREFNFNSFIISVNTLQELPEDITLSKFYTNIRDQIKATPETRILEEAEDKFKGYAAKKLVYQRPDQAFDFIYTVYFVEIDGDYYRFMTAENLEVPDAKEELNQVLDSFEFIRTR